jgi:DNA-binding phage protein
LVRSKCCNTAYLKFEWILDLATAFISVVTAKESSFCLAAEANDGKTLISLPPSNDGTDTSEPEHNMITTRDYRETIIARIKREPKFAQGLYAEAVNAILEGETAEGLSMLRDLVHAEISFKELARQTGLGEKSLHRMLNRNGNPTARNLGLIVKSIAEDLGIKPCVKFA